MKKTLIKICDVRSLDSLAICKCNNVDFIGIHIIDLPISDEQLELYYEIVQRANPIKTVLLTKTVPVDILVSIIKQAHFDYIQIHRPCSIEEVVNLKNTVLVETGRKIGVITVFEAHECDFSKVREMSNYADYILFDSKYRGGTGLRILDSDLNKIVANCSDIPYFIAGGLKPENVGGLISFAHPFGVDVQTGVECAKHVKEPEKVRAFVHNVRAADAGILG